MNVDTFKEEYSIMEIELKEHDLIVLCASTVTNIRANLQINTEHARYFVIDNMVVLSDHATVVTFFAAKDMSHD